MKTLDGDIGREIEDHCCPKCGKYRFDEYIDERDVLKCLICGYKLKKFEIRCKDCPLQEVHQNNLPEMCPMLTSEDKSRCIAMIKGINGFELYEEIPKE
jgi:hypothetical protein